MKIPFTIFFIFLFASIIAQNNPPIAVHDTVTTFEDIPLPFFSIDVQDNDSDPDGNLLITQFPFLYNPVNGFGFVDNQDSIRYIPNANFFGYDTIGYRICDDTITSLCSDTGWVFITVTPVNDQPTAFNDNVALPEDSNENIDVQNNDTDIEGDLLFTSIYKAPGNGMVVILNNDSISYTPNPNYYGLDTIEYIICDTSLCDTAYVFITVTPVNDPPVANKDTFFIVEDSFGIINVLTNDIDIEDSIIAASIDTITGPNYGSLINNLDSTFTYTPNLNYFGADSFQYRFSNKSGESDTAWVLINVLPVNDRPSAFNDNVTLPEDSNENIDVQNNDTDIEGDLLFTSIYKAPGNGMVVILNNDSISYTPNPNYYGLDTIEYIICDTSLCDTAYVYATVTGLNDEPYALTDTFITDEDSSLKINVLLNDYDIEGFIVPSTLSSSSNPANGIIINNNDSTFTYFPDQDYSGTDTFSYKICDNQSACSIGKVFIIINEINDPPIAAIDTSLINSAHSIKLNVLKNDKDIDGNLDVSTVDTIFSTSNGIIINNSDSTFTYQPNANYIGVDSFMYIVCDDGSPVLCDTANVYILISKGQEPLSFFIPDGFSPNGDGYNEYFVIRNIQQYPDNELIIFNRWQNVVYKQRGYNNNWRGTDMNGEMLPDDTYYYLLMISKDSKYVGTISLYR